jgi:hypothetical protein
MLTFLLRFRIYLEGVEIAGRPAVGGGLLFHRWLPNGEADALSLVTPDVNTRLQVWIERTGYVENGWIQYDPQRHEVDPEVMNRQGILVAGPLRGSLELTDVSEDQIVALREGRIGSDPYVALGKRVIKKVVGPAVPQFVKFLKITYGQYWLADFDPWDSRRESLGSYCGKIHAQWSLDDGAMWREFVPDNPIVYLEGGILGGSGRRFREYITEQDWREIETALRARYEPTSGAPLLRRAQRLIDQGELRLALVEAVVALELSLSDFMRQRQGLGKFFEEALQSFWQLPLRSQLVVVASASALERAGDLGDAVEAIEARNKVVHEGWSPGDKEAKDVRKWLMSLLRVAAALLPGTKVKLPWANLGGNYLLPPEAWEASYQSSL